MDIMITNQRVIRPRSRIYAIASLKSPRLIEAQIIYDRTPILMWPALCIVFGFCSAIASRMEAELLL
jgi:hypothetical protein